LIGIQDGEWDDEGVDGRGLKYYNWDQDTFKKTKRALRVMFSIFWNYRDFTSYGIDADLDFDLKKELRELMNFNLDGVDMNWFMRRRLRDRPFDKNDEDCE
jgi:hypothetical protein